MHPNLAFRLCAVVAVALGRENLALRLLLSFGVADAVNFILKQWLCGDRPYWVSAEVLQFSSTCEAGYGMPSGHMNAVAAMLTVLDHEARSFGLRCAFAALLVVTAVSRVVTGSHFPSQTVARAVLMTGRGVV